MTHTGSDLIEMVGNAIQCGVLALVHVRKLKRFLPLDIVRAVQILGIMTQQPSLGMDRLISDAKSQSMILQWKFHLEKISELSRLTMSVFCLSDDSFEKWVGVLTRQMDEVTIKLNPKRQKIC